MINFQESGIKVCPWPTVGVSPIPAKLRFVVFAGRLGANLKSKKVMRTQQTTLATREEKQAYANALAKSFVANVVTDFNPHELHKVVTDCIIGLVHVYGEDGFTQEELRAILVMDQLRKAFYQAAGVDVTPPEIG